MWLFKNIILKRMLPRGLLDKSLKGNFLKILTDLKYSQLNSVYGVKSDFQGRFKMAIFNFKAITECNNLFAGCLKEFAQIKRA